MINLFVTAAWGHPHYELAALLSQQVIMNGGKSLVFSDKSYNNFSTYWEFLEYDKRDEIFKDYSFKIDCLSRAGELSRAGHYFWVDCDSVCLADPEERVSPYLGRELISPREWSFQSLPHRKGGGGILPPIKSKVSVSILE